MYFIYIDEAVIEVLFSLIDAHECVPCPLHFSFFLTFLLWFFRPTAFVVLTCVSRYKKAEINYFRTGKKRKIFIYFFTGKCMLLLLWKNIYIFPSVFVNLFHRLWAIFFCCCRVYIIFKPLFIIKTAIGSNASYIIQ